MLEHYFPPSAYSIRAASFNKFAQWGLPIQLDDPSEFSMHVIPLNHIRGWYVDRKYEYADAAANGAIVSTTLPHTIFAVIIDDLATKSYWITNKNALIILALNKVFARPRNTRGASREHVELLVSLQQAVLEGLGYLEENKRELPIWGIPPFENHQVCFHPDHTPPKIRDLIQDETNLVHKDFDMIIGHWKSLKSKVDRYLDVLLQFHVLEQQELTVSQSHLATQQQTLAIDEARSSRVQSRSVFISTAITIIFLPLSFFTLYFGMNLTDIAKTVHTSRYFWVTAGPGITVIAILVIMKFLNIVEDPVLDEEKATTSSEAAESERSWRSRWRLRKRKFKSS